MNFKIFARNMWTLFFIINFNEFLSDYRKKKVEPEKDFDRLLMVWNEM